MALTTESAWPSLARLVVQEPMRLGRRRPRLPFAPLVCWGLLPLAASRLTTMETFQVSAGALTGHIRVP